MAAALLLETGCGSARPISLLDDLRFVAAAVDPPELEPGGMATVTWAFVDAGQTVPRPLDYLFVACTRLAGAGECLELRDLAVDPAWVQEDGTVTEEGYRACFARFSARGQVDARSLELTFQTASAVADLLTEDGAPPPEDGSSDQLLLAEVVSGTSLLLCADNACATLLEEVDAFVAGEPIARSGGELLYELVEGEFVADLERASVARATKSYLMSQRDEATRNHAPALEPMAVGGAPLAPGALPAVASGEQVVLSVSPAADARESYVVNGESGTPETVSETLSIAWYSTGGAITPGRQRLEDLSRPVEVAFTAPVVTEATDLLLYVTIADERYGSSWLEYGVRVTP